MALNSNLPILNYNGNTYVPLRSVSESLGAEVKWDNVNKRVNIYNDTYGLTTKELLNSIDDSVKINDHVYTISTYIHKDVTIIDPTVTSNYGIGIFIKEDEGDNFLGSFDIDKVIIIGNNNIYTPPAIPVGCSKSQDNGDMILHKHIPSFPPDSVGKTVDVIVRLLDGDKNTYLLRAAKQKVYITQY